MTKQDYNYLNTYLNGRGRQLCECYERPSIEKMNAFEAIKMRDDYNIGSLFVVSFSKFVFIACYRTKYGNYAIVTPNCTKSTE